MTQIDLTELGFTKEQIAERVVDKICDQVMSEKYFHPDYEEEGSRPSTFQKLINEKIEVRINEAVDAVAKKYTLPKMEKHLESFVIQRTNQWGEKQGETRTFVEHLTHQAESWFLEPVNLKGKTKKEEGYNWSKYDTRGAHMVDKYLRHSINTALTNAFKELNEGVAGGLKEAINIQLSEVLKKIKVQPNITTR